MGTETGQRPTIKEVEPVYLAMMEDVQQVLTDRFGVGEWIQHREKVGGYGCDDVENGELRSYNLGSAGPISEADWASALGEVQGIVAEHGFTELDPVIDEAGDHTVRITNPDGGYVDFGTKAATILTVWTGCHPSEGGTSTPAIPARNS